MPRMNCRICSAVSASSPASSFSSTYFRMSAFRWSSSVLSPAPRQHSRAASSTARSMVTRSRVTRLSRGCHVSRSLPATPLTTCLRTPAAALLHVPHLGAMLVCSPRQVPAPLWPRVSMSRRKRSGLLAAGGGPGYVTSS